MRRYQALYSEVPLHKHPVVARDSQLQESGAIFASRAANMFQALNFNRHSGQWSLTDGRPDEEPSTDNCDTVVAVPIHGFFREFYDSGLADRCEAFKLFKFPDFGQSGGGSDSPSPFYDSQRHVTLRSLLLPLLFINFELTEIEDVTKGEAFNRSRMQCVSGAAFLGRLGVTGCPVWGLTVSGLICVLTFSILDSSTTLSGKGYTAAGVSLLSFNRTSSRPVLISHSENLRL